jgi:hypothetical protein
MISGVISGTAARAVEFLEVRPSINAGREVEGSPRGRAAAAILGPRLPPYLDV